jgi:signal transduction histidine kinase
MSRHRNYRHERFAQALAEGKSRAEAMIVAGYKSHRGNQNRLAQLPDVVARVEEIRKHSEQIVDLRKIDRGRLLIELARIACADAPLRAAIAQAGPEALGGAIPPVLLVDIRLDGVLAKHIEMRLLDERGALSALLRYDNAPDRPARVDFSPTIPADFADLEQMLRNLLVDRELHSPRNNSRHQAQPNGIAEGAGNATGSPS